MRKMANISLENKTPSVKGALALIRATPGFEWIDTRKIRRMTSFKDITAREKNPSGRYVNYPTPKIFINERIFTNPSLTDLHLASILVHEYAHYIFHRNGGPISRFIHDLGGWPLNIGSVSHLYDEVQAFQLEATFLEKYHDRFGTESSRNSATLNRQSWNNPEFMYQFFADHPSYNVINPLILENGKRKRF